MTIRISLDDLPPRPGGDERASYRLACDIAGVRREYPLPEGDSVVGSSGRCSIRLEAPGVRSRHLRLKRHGDGLYVEPLGGARVLVAGVAVGALAALAPGQALAFGGVTAHVERVAARDRTPGVRVARAGRDETEDAAGRPSPVAIRQLGALNDCLDAVVGMEPASAAGRLLEGLGDVLGPVPLRLLRRTARGEWVLVAERGTAAGEPTPAPDGGDGEVRATLADGSEVLLAVGIAEASAGWTRELARLALVAYALRAGAGPGARRRAQGEPPARDVWHEFVGSRIRAHLGRVGALCRYCESVLVLGETGTGKELVARALHALWGRPGDLVAINCAAIPDELLDAELFGIEAGAATGVTARQGRFEQAEGGTLFLDEISEMPIQLQSKLLRVLQEREYFSVGGRRLRRADVRVVAASNRKAADLQGGSVRADLYFRLAQATVELPPLRDRVDDLAALCEHELGELEALFGRGIAGMSLAALDRLKQYAWPGNIRELQNVLRGVYAAAPRGSLIQSAHLPETLQSRPRLPSEGTLDRIVRGVETEVVERELARHASVAAAAAALGLSEGYLYRKIKRLGLARPGRRAGET